MHSLSRYLQPRLLLKAWLNAWVATLTLFHIHIPDTTDEWSALKSGGAHTIFTPDLPGEYSHTFLDRQHQQQHSSHFSERGVNSPEFGIAALDETDDRKGKGVYEFGVPYEFPDIPLQPGLVFAVRVDFRPFQSFQLFIAARAPPQLTSL